jgi:hypothetical protein
MRREERERERRDAAAGESSEWMQGKNLLASSDDLATVWLHYLANRPPG